MGFDLPNVSYALECMSGIPFSPRCSPSFAKEVYRSLIAEGDAFVGGKAWASREVIESAFTDILARHVIVVPAGTSEASGPTREATRPAEGKAGRGAGGAVAGVESKGLFP